MTINGSLQVIMSNVQAVFR